MVRRLFFAPANSPHSMSDKPLSFQGLILKLHDYWSRQGCVILQPHDVEVGAGTLHPATVLRALGPKPWRAAYVQPSRRPADGRYGENPKPAAALLPVPGDPEAEPGRPAGPLPGQPRRHRPGHPSATTSALSRTIGKNPTVGAWGLGWEVWCDGMEVTQYTYFQQVGGLDVWPVAGELTYGLERLAMYLQGVNHFTELAFKRPRHALFPDLRRRLPGERAPAVRGQFPRLRRRHA